MTIDPQHRRHRLRLLGLAGILFVFSIVIVGVTYLVVRPAENVDKIARMIAGQIVDQPVTYHFPSGNRRLHIVKDNLGNVKVTVQAKATVQWCIPLTKIPYKVGSLMFTEYQITFESERDWFVTIDQFERLWTFHGHWDKAWGPRRKMPSGGSRPYAPAVHMDGLRTNPTGGISLGGEVVTSTQNWAGVPTEFFNRLPGRDEAEWGNTPPLPDVPPTLTPQQQLQLQQALQARYQQ